MPAQASPKRSSASGLDVHPMREEAWILSDSNKSCWNHDECRALSHRSAGSCPVLWRETRSRVEHIMQLSNKSQAKTKVNVYSCKTLGNGVTVAQSDGMAPRQGLAYDA